MKVLVSILGERISPVLDVARRFLLVELNRRCEISRREIDIEATHPALKAEEMARYEPNVVICGAVSRPLEAMLLAAGMQLVFNTCGPWREVLTAFIRGELKQDAFLMPGCPARAGRRRRLQCGRRGRRKQSGRR